MSQAPKPFSTTPVAPGPAVPDEPTQTVTQTITLQTDNPEEMCKQAKDLHLYSVAGSVIGAIAGDGKFLNAPDALSHRMVAEAFLNELIRSIKPRDAVEEMLVIQMALVHQRIANLSLKAAEQVLTKNVAVVNHALDQACSTFRKQMLALAEYRRPPRVKVFAAINNANMANQQVVQVQNVEGNHSQNGDYQDEFRANELGSGAAPSAALPALGGGSGVASGVSATTPAVGAEHGSTNGNGQGSFKAERAQARSVQRAVPRRASRNEQGCPASAQRRRRTS